MNYEEIAKDVDYACSRYENKCGENILHVAKIIERACLEAQLEVIREIHKRKNLNHSAGDTLGTAYYNSVSSIDEEIEAKLKAMK